LPANQSDVERLIREATFLTGGNSSLLTAYLDDPERYRDDKSREDGTHIAKLSDDHDQLRDAIYGELAKIHKQDLEGFINNEVLDVAAITEEQLNKFRPITEKRTWDLCKKALPGVDEKRFTQLLNDLSDHGYVTLVANKLSLDGEDVYPKTIYALAHYARRVGMINWKFSPPG